MINHLIEYLGHVELDRRYFTPCRTQSDAIDLPARLQGQQTSSIDLHAAYLDHFAELRDQDITRFLEFVRTRMNGVPDARSAREYLKRLAIVRKKIADEDDRLFAGISEILDEEQMPGLSRVRLARDRQALTSGLADSPGGDVFDLWGDGDGAW